MQSVYHILITFVLRADTQMSAAAQRSLTSVVVILCTWEGSYFPALMSSASFFGQPLVQELWFPVPICGQRNCVMTPFDGEKYRCHQIADLFPSARSLSWEGAGSGHETNISHDDCKSRTQTTLPP